jgi:hypothetical protein
MTMYLPNRDVRPTGYEAGEFLEPSIEPPTAPSITTSETDADERVSFLRTLMQEDGAVDLDILKYGNDAWAIHGVFPYDGEVPMAVFDSYDEAKRALDAVCRPAG